ncbi:hypothetical protein QE197_24030 (plasmid) [Arsenophonus nasoniae]|nr:hypothetical protein [Arsenophonus nasoniae]WGM13578.1 hypothetical protein QE197_24005 [Arsenophonus nasoniae]WGM13579.1 hypothetical protein QE197_24030 [Arsenophonus nasoniae]
MVSTAGSYFTRLRLATHYFHHATSPLAFLTITGRYLMLCFGQPLELCCSWLANRVSKLVFSVPCILMAGNSINIRMFMFPSLEGFG